MERAVGEIADLTVKCAAGGGYVAGRADLIDKCAARLSAPGLSTDAGNVSGEQLRLMFQGLFLAPQVTGEALKVRSR